jgi:hypothetical protein
MADASWSLPVFKHENLLAGGRGVCVVGSYIDNDTETFFMNLVGKADHFHDHPYFVWNSRNALISDNVHKLVHEITNQIDHHACTRMLFLSHIHQNKIEHLPTFIFFGDHPNEKDDSLIWDIATVTNTTFTQIKAMWDACVGDGKFFVYSNHDQKIYWFAKPCQKASDANRPIVFLN